MKQTLFVFFCCGAFLVSCKDSAPVNGTEITATIPAAALYPLESGRIWNYRGTTTLKNFRPAVYGAQFPDTSWSWIAATQTMGLDTLPNGQVAWRLHTSEGSPATNGDTYYLLTHDTLFLYAYTNASRVAPKQAGGMSFRFAGRSYRSAGELAAAVRSDHFPVPEAPLELVYELKPPKVLVFPLITGKEWDYRESGYPGFRIGKKVAGQAPAVIGGMTFLASNVVWRWDMNNDRQWDADIEGLDVIGTAGLARRTFTLRNLGVSDVSSPEIIGTIDMVDEYSLTSIQQVIR